MRKEFEAADPIGAPVKHPDTRPPFPSTIRIAGILLIVFGAALLLNAVVTMGLAGGAFGAKNENLGGGVCVNFYPVLLGIGFIVFGIQILKGAEGDTLLFAFFPIFFGLSPLAYGAEAILASFAPADWGLRGLPEPTILAILEGVRFVVGLGLETAGILALVGRADYRAWRRWQNDHKSGDSR